MTITIRIGVIATCVATCVMVAGAQTPGSKRVVRQDLHVDGSRPSNLEALASAANLIVDAVVESETPSDVTLRTTPPRTMMFTVYGLRVTEVIKDTRRTVSAGAVLALKRSGGIRDRGSFLEELAPAGFDSFRLKERYLLFLKSSDAGVELVAPSGEGAALITNSQLRGRGTSQFANWMNNRSYSEVRATLRSGTR